MDPTECYWRWFEAEKSGDTEEADWAWDDLAGWIKRGGFEPDWSPTQRAEFYAAANAH